MGITFGNIAGEESSTITFKVGTVVIPRGSTNEQQEILVIGDPQTSNGLAVVKAAAPASTEFALVVRLAGGPSSVADCAIRAVLPSTATDNPVSAAQAGSWTVRATVSSTAADNPVSASQAGAPWSVTFAAGLISSNAQSGNSSGLTVRPVWSSSNADQPVRAVLSSTAADNPVQIASIAAGAGRINIGSTAADNVVSLGSIVAGAGRINIGSTAADNVVSLGTIAAGAGRINIGSTAADNVVRALLSSTNTDNPVRALLSSTSSDNPIQINTMLDSSNAAVKVADSANNAVRIRIVASDLSGSTTVVANIPMQSTSAPSSASSGVIVRQVIDNILTTASTNAFSPSTSLTIQSSGAALRAYVTAYSILSTNAGPHRIKFYSSNTMVWPVIFAAVSSAVSGANLAVSAPAYLFRTAASEALSLRLGSGASTIAGYQVGVSYFIAP